MNRPKIKLTIEDLKDVENIEAVYQEVVKKAGNGAAIPSMKKHLGKDAIVTILQKDPRHKKITKKEKQKRNKEFKKEFEQF